MIPKLQPPATAHSRGAAFLSGVCTAAARTIWCSFHLGCHRSAVSRSASNGFPLTQTIALMWGLDLAKGRSSPTKTPVFPPSSSVLPSFEGFCIFFSTGQALLSTFSWCSACTSMSEGVFLIYPWKEMCSTSTYSSAVLPPVVSF